MRLSRVPSDEQFFGEYRDYLVKVLGRSPATAKGYIGMGRQAAARMGKSVLKVDSDDLIVLIESLNWKPASKRALVVAWHSIDRFARMKGYGGRNGIVDLQTPSVPREKKPPISIPDAYRLLKHSTSPIQARVSYLHLYAGMRIAESTDVDETNWLEDRFIVWGKGNKKRIVPVHPELARVRNLILSKPPASKTSAGVIFGRLIRELDIRDVEGEIATPHSLRRTFSTVAYANGGLWELVETLLGHETGVTGGHYVDFQFQALDGTVRKVEYPSGEPVQLRLEI